MRNFICIDPFGFPNAVPLFNEPGKQELNFHETKFALSNDADGDPPHTACKKKTRGHRVGRYPRAP
jgi:hypothetical protein